MVTNTESRNITHSGKTQNVGYLMTQLDRDMALPLAPRIQTLRHRDAYSAVKRFRREGLSRFSAIRVWVETLEKEIVCDEVNPLGSLMLGEPGRSRF
jgi:hypothetical protein